MYKGLIRNEGLFNCLWYSGIYRGGGRIFEGAYSKRALIQVCMVLMIVLGDGGGLYSRGLI